MYLGPMSVVGCSFIPPPDATATVHVKKERPVLQMCELAYNEARKGVKENV